MPALFISYVRLRTASALTRELPVTPVLVQSASTPCAERPPLESHPIRPMPLIAIAVASMIAVTLIVFADPDRAEGQDALDDNMPDAVSELHKPM